MPLKFRVKIAGTPKELHDLTYSGLIPQPMWNDATRYEDERIGYLIEINAPSAGNIGQYSVRPYDDPRKPIPIIKAADLLGNKSYG